MYDPELYRAKDEVERWRARPDPRARALLRESGAVDEDALERIEDEVMAEV
jgi:TPP-dependent pyruvate/acetoin dehydrogenase alpha subunit